jgi:hypothetical protein
MRIAEGVQRLALAGGQRGAEVLRAVDPAHALAAAAGAGLDQHRIADLGGTLGQEVRLLAIAVVAGRQRHAGLGHQRLGGRLAAHRADRAGRRAGLGEVLVLGQEAVAGVNRLRAGGAGRLQDAVAAQIALARGSRADADRLVGQPHMARVRVGLGMHRHRGDAQAPRGADDPAGDLAAVGDQDLREHGSGSGIGG